MPSSHLILCHPLLLLPPIPPSIRVFSNELTLCMMWPKYWSFRFSIIPSKEIPGLISFRMDWLDLLAVQGTLKSLLQHIGYIKYCKVCQELKLSQLLVFMVVLETMPLRCQGSISFQNSYSSPPSENQRDFSTIFSTRFSEPGGTPELNHKSI